MAAVAPAGQPLHRLLPPPAPGQRPEISAAALQALVATERARLAPEFEELYQQRAAALEADARAAARAAVERAEAHAQEDERQMQLASSSPFGLLPSSSTTAAERLLLAEGGAPPDAAALIAAAARERREIASLQGEIVQERVFCEELEASEQAHENQFREAVVMAVSSSEESPVRQARRRPPTPPGSRMDRSNPSFKQLEEKAWRSSNAANAAEALEELLVEHEAGLRQQLADAEALLKAEQRELESAEQRSQEATACRELPKLKERHASVREQLHQCRAEEEATRRAFDSLQHHVLDLSGECGASVFSVASGADKEVDEQQLVSLLQATLPPGSSAAVAAAAGLSLQELLERLETERVEVHDLLPLPPPHDGAEPGSFTDGGSSSFNARVEDSDDEDAAAARLLGQAVRASASQVHPGEARLRHQRNELENLRVEVAESEARNRQLRDETREMHSESQAVVRNARSNLEDNELHLSQVRQELDLLKRQQVEWQKTQHRTIRLVEDLQRERTKGAHAQAVVASRLTELQREAYLNKGKSTLPSEPTRRRLWPAEDLLAAGSEAAPGTASYAVGESSTARTHRLEAVRGETETLRQHIERLEKEKVDLIHGQQGLIEYVKAKLPQLEGAALQRKEAR